MSDHHEPEHEAALFYIEGPDEHGCVWMHGASSKDPWARNLGPTGRVAELLSQWISSTIGAETRKIDAEEARELDA